MSLAELSGLVAHPVFGQAGRVIGLPQRRVLDRADLAQLVLVQLPDPGRRLVYHQHAAALIFVQYSQHGSGERGLVQHDLLAYLAWQRYLLVQAAAGAGEDGDGAGRPAAAVESVPDPLDVAAHRQPGLVPERVVLAQRPDPVQQAGHPGAHLPGARARRDAPIEGEHRQPVPVESDDAGDRLRPDHALQLPGPGQARASSGRLVLVQLWSSSAGPFGTERATASRLAYSPGGMARSARIPPPGAPAARAALISSSLPAGKSTSRRACRS